MEGNSTHPVDSFCSAVSPHPGPRTCLYKANKLCRPSPPTPLSLVLTFLIKTKATVQQQKGKEVFLERDRILYRRDRRDVCRGMHDCRVSIVPIDHGLSSSFHWFSLSCCSFHSFRTVYVIGFRGTRTRTPLLMFFLFDSDLTLPPPIFLTKLMWRKQIN